MEASEESRKQGISKEVRNPKFGPLQAILATVGILILAEAAVYLIFSLGFALSGVDREQALAWLENPLAQFIAILATAATMMGLLKVYLKKAGISWSAIGVVKPKLNDAWKGLFGFGIYLVVSIVVLEMAANFMPGLDVNQEQELGFDRDGTIGIALLFAFAGLTILPALIEEVLFRGLLYTGLRARLNFILTALITSVVFAAGHLQIGFGNSPLWVAAIDTFALSLILVYLREKYGSIWPGSIVHFVKNSLAFILIFVLQVT